MPQRLTVALTIAVVTVVGGTAIAQTAQRFSDMPLAHEAHEAVEWAASVGLTVGYGDGTFGPDDPLSRWQAVTFMERYYDDVLQASESEDFTRGDMMMLLHEMAGKPSPAATPEAGPQPSTSDSIELTGHGPATTRPVTLSEGVWDITIGVAGNANRPFSVDSVHDRYSHFIDDWTTQRVDRLDSLWTDDPATWHQVGIVSDTDTCCFNTVYRYGERTRFEVTAEPSAAWSISLAKRPWPPARSSDPDTIVVWGTGDGDHGPHTFPAGSWKWEFFAWNTSPRAIRASLIARDANHVTLMGYDTWAADTGRGQGGFYLQRSDSTFRPREGDKYVSVTFDGGSGSWVLTMTRTEE